MFYEIQRVKKNCQINIEAEDAELKIVDSDLAHLKAQIYNQLSSIKIKWY